MAASLHYQFLSCSVYTGVEGITVATASKDRTLRLWKFDTEDSINNPIRIRAFKILRGHTKSVQCVAAQNTGDMVRSIFFFWLYLLIFQYLKKNIDIYVGKMRFKVKLIISSFFRSWDRWDVSICLGLFRFLG